MTSYYAGATMRTLRALVGQWDSLPSEAKDGSEPGGSGTLRDQVPVEGNNSSKGKGRARLPAVMDLWHTNGTGGPAAASTGTPDEGVARPSTPSLNEVTSVGRDEPVTEDDRVLFRAGTSLDPYDPGSTAQLPLLALCPCNLPDVVDAARADRLSRRLDTFAQDPYLLVLFASPGPSLPVSQLVGYYRGLSAEARRNVKRIWLCHPGLLTRIAVKLFLNTIVSGKVTRKGKLKLVNSLSELAKDINITQLAIPPAVLIRNAKNENRIALPPNISPHPIFGISLSKAMPEGELPQIVRDCLAHLRTHLDTVGLFRRVPKITHLDLLKAACDRGHPLSLAEWPDSPVLAASLLKAWLKSLPTPVLPSSFYESIKRAPVDAEKAALWIREEFLPRLREDHPEGENVVRLFSEVIGLLIEISQHHGINKMDSTNLAIVISPVLVRSADVQEDAMICRMSSSCGDTPSFPWANKREKSPTHAKESGTKAASQTLGGIVRICIEQYDVIFGGREGHVEKSRFVSSPSLGSSTSSSKSGVSASPSASPHRTPHTMKASRATLRLLNNANSAGTERPKATRAAASRETVQGLFSGMSH